MLWLIFPSEYRNPYPAVKDTPVTKDAHLVRYPSRRANAPRYMRNVITEKTAGLGNPSNRSIGPYGGW
jgi:hypothetical protein